MQEFQKNTWFWEYDFNNFRLLKIKNETKEQKGGLLSMLLSTLGASLLGYLITGKGNVRAGTGNKKGKGIVRAGAGKQWNF